MTACEIKSQKKADACGGLGIAVLIAASTVGGVIIATAFPALAVDLVNRDKAPREVTVNDADGSSKQLTVKAGQQVKDICSECVILVGQSSVETKGRSTVKIEGGEVSIASQR